MGRSWADICEEEEAKAAEDQKIDRFATNPKPPRSRRQVVAQALQKKKQRWIPLVAACRILTSLYRQRHARMWDKLKQHLQGARRIRLLRNWIRRHKRGNWIKTLHALAVYFWFDCHSIVHIGVEMVTLIKRVMKRNVQVVNRLESVFKDLKEISRVKPVIEVKPVTSRQIVQTLNRITSEAKQMLAIQRQIHKQVPHARVKLFATYLVAACNIRVVRWRAVMELVFKIAAVDGMIPDAVLLRSLAEMPVPDDPSDPLALDWSKSMGVAPIYAFSAECILRGRQHPDPTTAALWSPA